MSIIECGDPRKVASFTLKLSMEKLNLLILHLDIHVHSRTLC